MSTSIGIFAADEWRRHGAIMPACLAGMMLVAVHNYTLGVMLHPLELAFGWTRAQISIGPMIPSLAAVIMAPLVGIAIDRQGPRRIALVGVPFFSAALALMSLASASIWSWWALCTLLGVATMFIFPMVWTAAINARFVKNRGLALAIALAGTGISASILPLIATSLLEHLGWQNAYRAIGLLCFVFAFPLVYFLFDRNPRRMKVTKAKSASQVNARVVRDQMLSPRFLKLIAATAFFSLATCALTSNAVPILLSKDFSASVAAALAGLVGIGSIIGRLGCGFLLDRFDARFVAAVSVLAPSASALLLLANPGYEASATMACFLLGLAAGAEYDACAYLTARHFGIVNFGALFGLVAGVVLLTNGVAPALSNHIYDLSRSYDPVLWALLPMYALSAMLFVLLGRYPELPDDAAAH